MVFLNCKKKKAERIRKGENKLSGEEKEEKVGSRIRRRLSAN